MTPTTGRSLLILAALSVTTPAIADPPSAKVPYVVHAMGDSLTDARSGGGKFLDILRQRCPQSRFDNYGKGGEMVSQMRRRFADDLFAPGKLTLVGFPLRMEPGTETRHKWALPEAPRPANPV